LWDGARIRVVDFEYSGRSDRAFELAEVTEHISAWVDTEFDVDLFLGNFDLPPAEAGRLLQCRRLLAFEVLHVLTLQVERGMHINPQAPRNVRQSVCSHFSDQWTFGLRASLLASSMVKFREFTHGPCCMHRW
jgi:hypothetical protein